MQKEKIILYGAGWLAERLFGRTGWEERYQVVAIADSDCNKHGKMLGEIEIMSLCDALKSEWDYIAISVRGDAYREIRSTLDEAGISEERIISFSRIYNCDGNGDEEAGTDRKKTGLVFIFNHRYEKNLYKLRRIYGDRFSEMRFLMPFYLGGERDVIPVYDSSYYFQGFVSQAYERLMEMDVDYFLFIADDLMVHPGLDEWNTAEKLGLSRGKEAFYFGLSELNQRGGFGWAHMKDSSQPFMSPGMAWRGELPAKEDAFALFREFTGREYPREYGDELFQGCGCSKEEREYFFKSNGDTWDVPYPMARGYSDIFAVKKTSLGKTAHMFGIFAAMNMFVEIAVPTAIVLTVKKKNVSFVESSESGYEIIPWGEDGRLKIEKEYGNDLNRLLSRFPEQCLCIHPVKLSGWVI